MFPEKLVKMESMVEVRFYRPGGADAVAVSQELVAGL
jgi:hypothetical protein